MSRVSLLVALLSALFFVILISEPVQSSSASSSSPVLPSDRLARYLHLQKALEGKKRKRAYLPDARSFIHRTSAKRSANEHEILHAHDDHVHTDSHSKCTSAEHESRMREKYPELGTKEDFELLLREKMLARRERMSKRAVVTPPVTVAVVVIVIHEGEEEGTGSNIGLDQIESQFVVLNQDFNTTGGSGVDCQMSFKLEKVVRVDYHSRGWAAPPYNDTYFDQVIKPLTSQDPNNFLNIWVTDLAGTTLGYAQFPSLSGLDGLDQNGGDEATDGVVIRNTAFGTTGSVTAPYNGGRTTTHEVGHFFGLRHIWGDGAKGQCATDFCQDTPPADQPNYHCPSPAPNNCGGPNQIQNYMDYTDDACMDRFMSCQKERMITVLENSPRRGGLIVIGNGNLTYDVSLKIVEPEDGAICYNFDSSITPVFSVTNLGFETIYNATISIQFDGGALSTQNFEFPGGLDQNETTSVSWAMPVDLTALSEDNHAFVATIAGLNGGGSQDEDPFSDTDAAVFYLSKNRSETYEMDYEGLSDFPPAGWVVVNGGWDAVDDVPGADGENGISAVSPMYELDRIGTGYEMLYYAGFKVGADGSTLTFDIAYAPFTNGTHVATGDRLLIYIGTQCSDYVQLFYQKDALALRTVDPTTDSYVPTSRSDWRTETVVISESFLFGRAAVINFVTVTGGGNNLWIDNIRVTAGQSSAASGLSSWLSLSQ